MRLQQRLHTRWIYALSLLTLFPAFHALSGQEPQLHMERKEVEFEGSTISYWVGGAGSPILLIHGFSLTSHEWDPFLDALGSRHQVIVPDLPGHGYSEWLPGEFSYRKVAQAMFAVLDDLGIEEIQAAGHSAGGNTLVHMAVQHPERVEAMVLVAGGHRLVNGVRERLVGFDFDAASPALQEHYLTYHPGGAAQLDRIFEEVSGLANNYSDFNFSPEQLSIVPTRTLLVWGDRDPNYPLDIGVEMYEALPNASLWVVPSQGHFPLWPEFDGSEDAASIFVSVVSDFLEATGES